MATRPSSISNTPHTEKVGVTGRPLSQELFTYNLELALLSVLQCQDEYGRDAVFKWRSDEEVYKNAWSTPSYWDWTSSDSYVSECSTPGASTPDEPSMDEEIPVDSLPRAWTLIRNEIKSKVPPPLEHIKPGTTSLLKRKYHDEGDEIDEWLHPRKKVRCDTEQQFSINELTPPSSPPSKARGFIKARVHEPAHIKNSPRGISFGEITPPDVEEKTFSPKEWLRRNSSRLHHTLPV